MISWYASLLARVKAPSMVIPKPPPIWIWGQRHGRMGGGLLKIWDMGKSSILAIGPHSCTKVCLSKIWYSKDEIVIYQSKFWEKKRFEKFQFLAQNGHFGQFHEFHLMSQNRVGPHFVWPFLGKIIIIGLILRSWRSFGVMFFRFGKLLHF